MYICSCNTLTDSDVEQAIESGAQHPRDVYAVKGCKAECGGCTRTIVAYLRRNAMVSQEQEGGQSSCCQQPCSKENAIHQTAHVHAHVEGIKAAEWAPLGNSGKNSIFPCSN